MKKTRLRSCLVLAATGALVAPSAALLAAPAVADDRVYIPVDQVSIGMFSLIPWVGQDGLESVMADLSDIGFANVEPFGSNFNGYTAQEFRDLADGLDLRIPTSHYNVGEDTFDATLDFVSTLGQEYVGSGGFAAPGFGSLEDTLATAETMNRLGERSVEAGVGKFFGHNHAGEFTTTFEVDGEELSAWEILVENTDPEYVTFQVDVAWAAHAGVDVVELLEEHGERVELLHVKDATGLVTQERPTFVNLGEGDVPLQEILAAGQEAGVEYYTMEYDVSPDGQSFATEGFEYLTGIPAGVEPVPFVDVPVGNMFYTEISWLAQAGISTGWVDEATGEAEFRPLASIARDAMAAFLYRQAGSPEFTAPETSPFVDVAPTDQFYTEIAWLAEQGISTGWETPAGVEFRPLEPIARDAMAAFLHRAAGAPEVEPFEVSPFTDVTPQTQFYAEISWMVQEGLAFGWIGNDGTAFYQPLAPVARDAMAAFLYRYQLGLTPPV